jgi:hypothetical protein
MTDELRSPDPGDPGTSGTPAEEQRDEQDRLDEETRRRFGDDPGDPKDRLSEGEHDRLMQQTTYRELHP